MKIKSIHLKDFKRFTDLKIEGIPEKARLVVMIGPNGCGKSSIFDALLWCRFRNGGLGTLSAMSYYTKYGLPENSFTEPVLDFHNSGPKTSEDWQKSVHVRTAYRNDLVVGRDAFTPRTRSIKAEKRFYRLIENDEVVASNYSHVLAQWLEETSDQERVSDTIGDLQEEIFGELRKSILELFTDPELILTNLGSPSKHKVFQFNKGRSHGFSYQNLSSGEKASLDLILDIIISKTEFNDTIFCIDEPEAHIHTKLQGPLLGKLFDLISPNSQLWIATHSIGMVCKAQDLWQDNPDSVVFLDFGKDKLGNDINFDEMVTITPAEPNPNFWKQTYDVALGDLAELVITGRTVFCEGKGFDEECYRKIFKNRYPELCFDSLEGRENVVKSVKAANLVIGKIAKNAKVIGIVDGDRATKDEKERNAKEGIRTLSRKTIESYLLDDEVLTKLCEDHGEADKISDLLTAKQDALDKRNLKPSDKLKPIVQEIQAVAQNILKSVNLGTDQNSFMMDILAPLIQPGMTVYEELHKDIFGE